MPKESHGPWAPVTITPSAGVSVTSDLDSEQTLRVVARANAAGTNSLNTVTDDGPSWSGPNTIWILTITVQPWSNGCPRRQVKAECVNPHERFVASPKRSLFRIDLKQNVHANYRISA